MPRPRWGRSSAGCSPRARRGAGSSSSTCRSAPPPSCCVAGRSPKPTRRSAAGSTSLAWRVSAPPRPARPTDSSARTRTVGPPSVSGGCWWGAALLLAGFVAIEARTRHAMFDLALLRNRSFVAVLLAGLLLTFAAFTTFTYTSIWLQSVLGMSPLAAGLTGLPLSVTAFGISAVLGRVLHGRRPDLVIGAGLLFVGLGSLLTAALLRGPAGWPSLLPGLALVGVGVGLATPILGSFSMSLVPADRGGMAAGAVNTARQFGFAFGIAALGSVFTTRAQSILAGRDIPDPGRVAHAIAGGQTPGLLRAAPAAGRQLLDSAAHAAGVAGVQATFAVAGAVGVIAGLLVTVLMRPGRPRPAASADRPPVAEGAGR
ncbi:MFS transporter [Micromonospora sp. NPDC005173]|uniref:MFS transporter n=1 Tax=Micromonospora sp. NPDC005173 TaxID=3157165 RepID=UPI0033A7A825